MYLQKYVFIDHTNSMMQINDTHQIFGFLIGLQIGMDCSRAGFAIFFTNRLLSNGVSCIPYICNLCMHSTQSHLGPDYVQVNGGWKWIVGWKWIMRKIWDGLPIDGQASTNFNYNLLSVYNSFLGAIHLSMIWPYRYYKWFSKMIINTCHFEPYQDPHDWTKTKKYVLTEIVLIEVSFK